jgi:hypothetical protein
MCSSIGLDVEGRTERLVDLILVHICSVQSYGSLVYFYLLRIGKANKEKELLAVSERLEH